MLSPAEALHRAQQLIDDGYPFHAHEVFEGVWKATQGEHRALWQGLAQLAVGLTHIRRGNATGATALLRRFADRIDGYVTAPPHGLDIEGLAAHARSLVARLEQDGPDAVSPGDLRPQLVLDEGDPVPRLRR